MSVSEKKIKLLVQKVVDNEMDYIQVFDEACATQLDLEKILLTRMTALATDDLIGIAGDKAWDLAGDEAKDFLSDDHSIEQYGQYDRLQEAYQKDILATILAQGFHIEYCHFRIKCELRDIAKACGINDMCLEHLRWPS